MNSEERRSIELKNIARIIVGHDYNLNSSQCNSIKEGLEILSNDNLSFSDCVKADKLICKANINHIGLL